METVLVVKNNAYAINTAGTPVAITKAEEINTLADGALVLLTPDGNVVPAAGFGSSTQTLFQMALKTSDGILRSPLIERSKFAYNKQSYVAPVEQVQTLSFSGTPTVNKSAGVIIKPFFYVTPIGDKDYENFEVGVETGASLANVLTAVVAQINANSKYVTATATATTIVFTGKAGVGFNTSGTYELRTYTSAIGTAFVAGKGTSYDVGTKEIIASAHKGNARYKSFGIETYSQGMQTVKGTTYIQYDFTWQLVKTDQLNSKDAPYNQIGMLATPVGNTALVGVLDTIFASV